jgi:hypothetical protein
MWEVLEIVRNESLNIIEIVRNDSQLTVWNREKLNMNRDIV